MSILEKIYEASLKFLAPLNASETYEAIVREAAALVDGEQGSIYLSQKSKLKRAYASNNRFKLGIIKGGFRYKAFKKQTPLIVDKERVEKLEEQYPSLKALEGRSYILIPLSYKRQAIGLLSVISRKNKIFSRNELEILKLFGAMASLAIRKAQLYSETKEALDTRDLFIALAAHELRTPLTGVTGYIQMMKTKIKTKKQIPNKWVDDLDLENERLRKLVEEFLEIDRIKRGKVQYDWEETSFKKIIYRAISSSKFSHPTRKIGFDENLKDSSKDKIIGDTAKLIQVVTNIIENAIKYSTPDKNILVRLDYKKPDFILTITDQGQGIEDKDLPFIFQGFYKGRNSLHEGVGLGLFLAKNIIDSHHGDISIKSKTGEGTTVLIRLPEAENDRKT